MLIDSIKSFKIKQRLREFEELGKKGSVLFDFKPFLNLRIKANLKTELAFCISTANSSALSGLKFQKLLERGFNDIEEKLKISGVRFYKRKSEYIKKALENFDVVEKALRFDSVSARKRLLEIKGLGFKEASHFLRNIGRKDVAIIDRHILRWLLENLYIDDVPNLTPKMYLKIEKILRDIAEEKKLTIAELDLIIWSERTGMILK